MSANESIRDQDMEKEKMRKKHLFIRADANAQIGTGHLMRCLALAQAWQEQGGETTFITTCDSDGLLQRLRCEEFQVVELNRSYPDPDGWELTSKVLSANTEAWVVLDGYHFDTAYQRRIREAGYPLLVIDDMAHLDHYYADVVLNQNICAAQLNYSCESETQLLLGTDYVLLRREFWPWRTWEREISDVARNVLITMGGSDPDNHTLKVVHALHQVDVDGLKAIVVIGASNPHYEELECAIRHSSLDICFVHNVTNMPELMAWADVAVAAGGSTCWELAFMSLPSLLLVLANNQQEIVKSLSENNIFHNLGKANTVDIKNFSNSLNGLINSISVRTKMSKGGRKLIDGYGSKRVLNYLSSVKSGREHDSITRSEVK